MIRITGCVPGGEVEAAGLIGASSTLAFEFSPPSHTSAATVRAIQH